MLLDLAQARKLSGLKTTYVAKYMNCSTTQIYRFEKGINLTRDKAARLVSLYRSCGVHGDICYYISDWQ